MNTQNLISILGLESLPEERKIAILNQAAELLEKRTLASVYESLPKNKQQELDRLLDNGDTGAIQQFMFAEAPNMAEVMEQEAAKLKEEFAGWAESL